MIKQCIKCKLDLPKTQEFFRERFNTLSSGEKSFYFVACCKKCEVILNREQRIRKRCKKEGWKIEDYEENIKKVIQENNKKSSLLLKKHVTQEQIKERNNRPTTKITDCYVRSILKIKDPPQEIIETKRLIIKLNRLIKK